MLKGRKFNGKNRKMKKNKFLVGLTSQFIFLGETGSLAEICLSSKQNTTKPVKLVQIDVLKTR
jgi:hypothetical protein